MPLIKHGKATDDPWTHVTDDARIPVSTPVIVSLARWKAERDELIGHNAPFGIRLRSDEQPEDVGEDVHRFDVIALDFSTFKDGRAYSSARLLRERYGYEGELRAVGNVLRDQLMFMARCGFDAFEVESDVESWESAMREIDVVYQPAADDRAPAPSLRRRGIVGCWAY